MSLENAFKVWKETGKMPFSIIQGGMGAGVSDYGLARTVSSLGEFGVVSGTAPEAKMVQELRKGDPTGEVRFALSKFPNQEIAQNILKQYFVEGGATGYRGAPFPAFRTEGNDVTIANQQLEDLIVAGSFTEVLLAKEDHSNPVGINLLYKIQWPLLPGIYGAMLAGADAVLMGAGFPTDVPPVIDEFSKGNGASMKLQMTNSDAFTMHFDPKRFSSGALPRPTFLGIVSNHLGVKGLYNADGYILEGPIAGGHNPPARSKQLDETGQPLYGEKDDVNFKLLDNLLKGRPYWLAGSYAGKLKEAFSLGAAGVQVGTPFAYSKDSNMRDDLRKQVLGLLMEGKLNVYTDPRASPTGFPFKVVQVPGTVSEKSVYDSRERVCDKGYLVELVERNGKVKTRCPSDDITKYQNSGGKLEDTVGRKCLCNGLLTTIASGSPNEPALLTSGADFSVVKDLVTQHGMDYSAEDAIKYMLERAK